MNLLLVKFNKYGEFHYNYIEKFFSARALTFGSRELYYRGKNENLITQLRGLTEWHGKHGLQSPRTWG
jgi:hypothetical protein